MIENTFPSEEGEATDYLSTWGRTKPIIQDNLEASAQSPEVVKVDDSDPDIGDAAEVVMLGPPPKEVASSPESAVEPPLPVVVPKQEPQPTSREMPMITKSDSSPDVAVSSQEDQPSESSTSPSPQERRAQLAVRQVAQPPRMAACPEATDNSSSLPSDRRPIKSTGIATPAEEKEIKEASAPASDKDAEPQLAPRPKELSDDERLESETTSKEVPERTEVKPNKGQTEDRFTFKGDALEDHSEVPARLMKSLDELREKRLETEVSPPPELQEEIVKLGENIQQLGEEMGVDLSLRVPSDPRCYRFFATREDYQQAGGSPGTQARVRPDGIYQLLSDNSDVNRSVLSHETAHYVSAQTFYVDKGELRPDGSPSLNIALVDGFNLPGDALKEIMCDLIGTDVETRSGSARIFFGYMELDVLGTAVMAKVAADQNIPVGEVYKALAKDFIINDGVGLHMIRESFSDAEFNALACLQSDGDPIAAARQMGLKDTAKTLKRLKKTGGAPAGWSPPWL